MLTLRVAKSFLLRLPPLIIEGPTRKRNNKLFAVLTRETGTFDIREYQFGIFEIFDQTTRKKKKSCFSIKTPNEIAVNDETKSITQTLHCLNLTISN